tara:strand:- start:8162 stop:10117 length:1956 start_codon:yes stop_codon:yes gene_type:complete
MADSSEELSKAAEKFSEKITDLSYSFKYALDSVKKIARESDLAAESFDKFKNVSLDLTKSLDKNKDIMKEVVEGELTAEDVAKKRAEHAKNLRAYNRQRKNIEKELSSEAAKSNPKKKKALLEELGLLKKKGQQSTKELKEAEKTALKGNNRLSKGLEGMSKTFKKFGFTDMSKSSKGLAASLRKSKIATGGIAKGLFKASGAMKMLGRANPFMALVGVLASIIKMALKINEETTLLRRNLGVSGSAAARVRQHFVNIAADTAKWGVTYEEVSEASNAVNNYLGTAATMIQGDILGGMAVMMKRMKITAQAAVGFAQAALAGSKSVEDLKFDTIAGARATEEEFGVRVDITKAIEATGKVTGRVRALFANNLELMSKTVTKANLLGLSMSDVANNSAKLLNFQTSIEDELKAELFLNKKLNLERARLASLTGDLDTYMSEIRKNAGDFYEFSNLNVMQQNALAQALGMGVDQLSDMLLREENLLELKERARREGNKELEQNLEALSINEAFKESMRQLKIIVLNMMAGLENFKIPGWLSKLLTGKRSTLGGKRVADIITDESTEKAVMKLQNINKDDSIYGDDYSIGGRMAAGGINLPVIPDQTPVANTVANAPVSPTNVNVNASITPNRFEGSLQAPASKYNTHNSGRKM